MKCYPRLASMPFAIVTISAFLLTLSGGIAHGAGFTSMVEHAVVLRDGHIHAANSNRAAPAEPQDASAQSNASVDIPADAAEGGSSSSLSPSEHRFVIEADDSQESIGDPVCVAYEFLASASASASDEGRAAAGYGGSGGSATATNSPLLAEVSVDDAADITVDPDGSGMVVYQSGPATVDQDAAPVLVDESGQFTARIGDEIRLRTLSVVAVSAAPGNTANATASALLTTRLIDGPCGDTPQIPTLHPAAMVSLAGLMAALGMLSGFRNRRRPVADR